MIPYNHNLKQNARELRKNMTPEEKKIWYGLLKKLPLTVKRQYRMENYIVDFYIPEKKTVIEIDGRQHLTKEHKEADDDRDKELMKWGVTVVRYPNSCINKDFNRVADHLLTYLGLDYSDLKK